MSIALQGSPVVVQTSAASATVGAPVGLTVGEIILLAISHQNQAASADWTLPSGWVRFGTPWMQNDANQRGNMLAYHVVTSADVSAQAGGSNPSWVFTYPSGSGRLPAWAFRFSGVDTTNPDAGHSVGNPATLTGATRTLPGFSVAVDNAYLVVIASNQLVSPSAAGVSVDSGMTQLGLVSSLAGADNTSVTRTLLGVFGKQLSAAGASPTPTVTWPTATGASMMSVALRPATVAPPATAVVKQKTAAGAADVLAWKAGASGAKLPLARVWTVGGGQKTPTAFIAKAGAICGHMGMRYDEVEGSMEGITRALMAGVDGLMLSLARTSDGKFFLLNDTKYLDRMQRGVEEKDGGTTLDSSAMTWAQVQAYDQGSYWTKRGAGGPRRPFLLLTDFLAAYPTVGPIMIDPKTIPSTYFPAILDLMDANGGPSRFIAKYYCTGTGWATAARARGYLTWGYFYASEIAAGTTPLATYAPNWDWLGLDVGGATAQWTAMKALGKPIIGHITNLRSDYDLGISKGANAIMAAGVLEARNLV